jgi:hypothetical protein
VLTADIGNYLTRGAWHHFPSLKRRKKLKLIFGLQVLKIGFELRSHLRGVNSCNAAVVLKLNELPSGATGSKMTDVVGDANKIIK